MTARILVVEDDDEYLRFLQLVLDEAGYLVHLAMSAQGALCVMSEASALPDLAIIDVGLPDKGMDGLDLCWMLKKNPATQRIPVIVLSAHSENALRLKAAVNRADMVLSKPIAHHELLLAVRTALKADYAPREVLTKTGVELDPAQETAVVRGRAIKDLGPSLFDLLYLLAQHAPNYVTGGRIMSSMHLFERDAEVELLVMRLRARLRREFGREMIVAAPDKGFRLDLDFAQAGIGHA